MNAEKERFLRHARSIKGGSPISSATPRRNMNSDVFFGAVIASVLSTVTLNSSGQNGSLDATFQAEANAIVRAIAVQTNGQIIIGGDFTSVNGVPCNYVARLNEDGNLDRTFDPGSGASGPIWSLALQRDGKALIAGQFEAFNDTPCHRIARLNTDGHLDTNFDVGLGANQVVYAVTLQTNGQVLIGGQFTTVNNTNRNFVARLNSDGSLDTDFETGGLDNYVWTLAVQEDGRILLGGWFTSIGGTPRSGIARLRQDGSLDTSFYPGAGFIPNEVQSLAVREDGKVFVGGDFYFFNGVLRYGIAALNPDGSLDATLSRDSGACCPGVSTLAVAPNHRIVLGGGFPSVNGTPATGIARLNADGTLDTTFSPGLANAPGRMVLVNAVAIQSDMKILIGGDFRSVNGLARVRIARLNADVVAPAATLSVGMYAGLTITGITGTTYRVEYTTDLTNQTLWRTLTDLNLSNSPQFFIDNTSPFSSRRYYRAVTLP